MKPSLQLKIGQSLTMTPQLQQAIRLLQLSSLDLQNEIQEALESNPMLEGNEESNEVDNDASKSDDKVATESSEIDSAEALKNENIEKELAVDTQWEDWQYTPSSSMSRGGDDRDFEYQGETSESLRDHLIWQLDLTPISERDKAIALILIDEIDDEGYIRTPLEEVLTQLNSDEQDELDEIVELEEIEAVLRLIQSFDPIGVAARNLKECLQLQLRHYSDEDPFWLETKQLVEEHFDALAARNYKQIMRQTKWPEDFLKEVMGFVQKLNPRPGSSVSTTGSEYIVPDVFVAKKNGRWTVELNPDCAPKLRINTDYASLIKRADSSSDNTYLKNNLQEAKWFIKSLQSRNETLLKVASCIVEKQLDFFEYGEEAMKPLVLSSIADEVEMHESTVSRVTTQKYMHTPRGIFELKYFFSSHVSTSAGGECSSTAIRALIKKLIAAENSAKPLSDNKIANLLKDQGINVARRTIAKYREAMNIPPSNERKSLI
ncbi:RNA polymerase factor sigma-54 [Pleionea sediminis]|uniref:RNA polymerase factor sigma-54 n=1 Tax=Pleionea sediminis TaxID=2569479 RepID=UPI001184D5E2|nr:RNA polymerase factor sigma-54 [Pleionea sediminis]